MQLSGLEYYDRQYNTLNVIKIGTFMLFFNILMLAVPDKNVCLTDECRKEASRILDYMDTTVDYCNDFYKFSCGKFINNTVIPEDQASISTFSILQEKFKQQLKAKIEEEIKPNEKKSCRLVKTLYQNCMNQTEINKKGVTPISKILEKLGGWPVVVGDSWNEEAFDWQKIVPKLKQNNLTFNYFFNIHFIPDYQNSTRNVLALDHTELILPYTYITNGINDKIVSAYYKYMVDIAVMFGANKTRAQQDFWETLDFEWKLGNFDVPIDYSRNITVRNNPMTVEELQTNFPSILWKDFFNAILSPNLEIGDDEVVTVSLPSYFKYLETVMNRTSKRTLANYLLWRVVYTMITYLGDDVRDRQLEFLTVLNGNTKRMPRWQECFDFVSENLKGSVASLFISENFDNNSKRSATEMVTNMREQFSKILKILDWMDQETRESALEKLSSMNSVVAYPDELLDDQKFEEYFNNLDLTTGDYFQSVLSIISFNMNNGIKKLRNANNNTTWSSHSNLDSASTSYFVKENTIQIPAGILQVPFFSPDRPAYMNYGALGYVIGHEITHAFDDEGSQFDKDGNLVEWWKPETRKKYLSKIRCIIDQYSNYAIEQNGTYAEAFKTQGENVADNGGIKAAYLAYQEWVRRNGLERKLPGLDYTPSQLFWISAAQVWCNVDRPEELKHKKATDPHSPENIRVLGSFSNMPEFAEDFKCPLGSRMNPIKKCSFW